MLKLSILLFSISFLFFGFSYAENVKVFEFTKEEYEKNFKAHEDAIAGAVAGDDLDMEELFAEAEKLLEDDDGSDGSNPTIGDTPDIEGGTTGGGTELPPTGSVPDKG